jgi:hypothetical protein
MQTGEAILYGKYKFQEPPMKTLFLQAPSFDGFDGGAGSRYQAKREIRSFWYPTWLAQPAALVPGSRVVDAPADGLSVEATLQIAEAYELVIIHTSTPSFPSDALFAEKLKARKPSVLIGMVGAKVAVDPHNSLAASDAIDFVCREEFDFTCMEVSEGKPFARILGLSYRTADGAIEHNEARPILEDMDALPFVAATCRTLTCRSTRAAAAVHAARFACGPRPWGDIATAPVL